MIYSDFMTILFNEIKDKKKISDSTATAYLRVLYKLNNDEPFNNLNFIKNKDEIINKISGLKADNTKKMYLGAICSILGLERFKSKPFMKAKQAYYSLMMDYAKAHNEEEIKNEKTEKQRINWLNYEDIIKTRDELKDKIKDNVKTEKQYNDLLNYLILSLYTYILPRRNLDYNIMVLNFDNKPQDTNKNYLILKKDNEKFIFNKYKTSKSDDNKNETPEERENRRTVKIESFELLKIIHTYFFNHPLIKGKPTKKHEGLPFLVYYDGRPFINNSITRVLNRIFKKNIGSSMLRHIIASYKGGEDLKELKQRAQEMGHSLDQHIQYIKK